jgi:hypothetical protein
MNTARGRPLTCLILVAAALCAAAAPGRARADFKVQYAIGSDVTTVTDNGAGDLDPTVGTIFISRTVDQVTLSIAANSNKGSAEPAAQVQDATVNIQNTANVAQNVRISVTDTNFTVPGTTGNTATLQSRLGISSIGGVVTPLTGTFTSYTDNSNAEFGKAFGTPSQNLVFLLPPSEQLKEANFTRAGNYSLTNEFLLTLPANQEFGASFTGTSRVFLTPAPTSALLLLSSLPALGLCWWALRRNRHGVAA